MIGDACRHPRCPVRPLGSDDPWQDRLTYGQRRTKALMRPGDVVKRLEEDDPATHLLAVFAKAVCLAHQGRELLAHREVHPLDQGRADGEATLLEPLGTEEDTRA